MVQSEEKQFRNVRFICTLKMVNQFKMHVRFNQTELTFMNEKYKTFLFISRRNEYSIKLNAVQCTRTTQWKRPTKLLKT